MTEDTAGTNPSSYGYERDSIAHDPDLNRLGLLVAGITHNLNGPLTGIIGTIELLSIRMSDDPKVQEDIERMRRLVDRIRTDVRTIVTRAGIEAKQVPVQINIHDVVQNTLDLFRAIPLLKHKITVDVTCQPDLPLITCLENDIAIAFEHVIDNAIDSMQESEKKDLSITISHDATYITVLIADTGCGMDETTLSNAFTTFFTTKPKPRRSYLGLSHNGIGLPNAVQLLKPYGGEISLQSTKGQGTTATVRIPVSP